MEVNAIEKMALPSTLSIPTLPSRSGKGRTHTTVGVPQQVLWEGKGYSQKVDTSLMVQGSPNVWGGIGEDTPPSRLTALEPPNPSERYAFGSMP